MSSKKKRYRRLVDIVHFVNGKVSGRLEVTDIEPSIDERGYVKKGAYFIAIVDGQGNVKRMKLSEEEMADLIRMLTAVKTEHEKKYIELATKVAET